VPLLAQFLPYRKHMNGRRQQNSPKASSSLDRLTPREHEITLLIGCAQTNKEIANHLNITEKTVKAHLTAVFRKLGLSNRLQLALYITEQNRMFH